MKKILFIIFILFGFNLLAQNETDYFCGNNNNSCLHKKKVWKNNNQFLLDYIENYPLLDSGYVYFRIPIVFHIYLNSKENTNLLYADIKRVIQRLNTIYSDNKTGIQFYLADVILIKNQKYLKTSYFLEAPFLTSKKRNRFAINVYYVNILEKKFFKKTTNYHGNYNPYNQSIISIRHASKTTLAHEIGHFLGLHHPHKNWKKGKFKQESVSRNQTKGLFSKRTNCEINGDGLSDTPAEPNLVEFTDKDCNYIGEITDDWGVPYQPNTNNIMSYPGNRNCRNNFTTMQKSVMLYTADHKKQSKIWRNTPENKHFMFDDYEPDDNINMASKILIDSVQYHTFHKVISDKANELKNNNLDYLTFIIDSTELLFVNFQEGEYVFPEIQFVLLDNSKKIVFKTIINQAQKIPLKNINGKYYLRIENISHQNEGKLFDYQINIEKK